MRIPFNKPYMTGKEVHYLYQAVSSGKLSGNGLFTRRCQQFFEQRYGFGKCLLTTSCTDALEMAALLLEVGPGDEVIVPSYTFVSTANAFVLRGATVVFADSGAGHPNVDVQEMEALITPRTKVLVVVHYAGMACDMDAVMDLAHRYGLWVVEDAAQAVDAYYKGRPLGGIGHLAAFSFHETKNIISGEGGMLVVNDSRFAARAEVIWEKGTNRSAFFRGETDKYNWLDVGSSFLPSETVAAFLYAQLEQLYDIQRRRRLLWERYWQGLEGLQAQGLLRLPQLPAHASNNGHLFYVLCRTHAERKSLKAHLGDRGILAVSHYLPLHQSPFYRERHGHKALPHAQAYADRLLRLPLFYELGEGHQEEIVEEVRRFYRWVG